MFAKTVFLAAMCVSSSAFSEDSQNKLKTPCDASLWNNYADNTQSPLFFCTTTKTEPSISIPFAGLTGIGDKGGRRVPIGDKKYEQFAQHLVQARTSMNSGRQEIGLAVNFLDVTGARPFTDHSNKTALDIFSLGRAGGGPLESLNTDTHVNAGFDAPVAGYEADLSIFDRDRKAGNAAGNAFGMFMTFTGYRATAAIDMSGNPLPGAASTQFGLLFQNGSYSGAKIGQGLVSDATINDSTNSGDVLRVYGNHGNVINTTVTNNPVRLWSSVPGQYGCFSIFDDCLGDVGNHVFRFTSNGGIPLQVVGSKHGVNGLQMTSAPRGSGPTLSVVSADDEKGLPLHFLGILEADGFRSTLTKPTSSTAPCQPGQSADDTDYHYVCVALNRWKRVALSSF
jgi:hypothetical protein